MSDARFERQIPFVTPEGQDRLGASRIAIVGIGGLGSHVVQQLAYLGVVNLTLIDPDRVERSNLNRLVTAIPTDIGALKVDVLRRFVMTLHPEAPVRTVPEDVRSQSAFAGIKGADYVVGCVDDDGPRFLLNQFAAAYRKPFLDLSTDIGTDRTSFGGKLVFVRPGQGCLRCRGLLDDHEVRAWLETAEEQRARERIYGQAMSREDGSGPSVVALNGLVASLGVMELLLEITGIRSAHAVRVFHGIHAAVVDLTGEPPDMVNCRICAEVLGQGDAADLERFIPTTT